MHAEAASARTGFATLLRGALAGALGEGVALPAALVSGVLLARHLGPEGFGVLGLAMAAAAAPAWVLASIVSRTALLALPRARAPVAAAAGLLRATLLWGALGWGAFALAGLVLAGPGGRPVLGLALGVAGADVALLAVARLHRSTLTAIGRASTAGTASGVFGLARLAATGLAIGLDTGPAGALAALALARVAEIAWCRRHGAIPLARPADRSAGAPAFGRGMAGTFLLQALCLQLFQRLDILLLSALGASGTAVGWYAAAQQVATAPMLAAGVVAPLVTVALVGAEAAERRGGLGRRADMVALGGLVAAMLGAGLAVPLAPVLFGPAYAPAAPLFAWLVLGGGGAWLLTIATARASAAGDLAGPLRASVALLALALLGWCVAIPSAGAEGAAAVTGLVALVAGVALHLALADARARLARRCVETAGALLLGGALGLGAAHVAGAGLAAAGLAG